MNLSSAPPSRSAFVDVLGSRMHYVESGTGDPIVFVHGNPTSSYLWRNVVPHVDGVGRAIAADLIGMGRSDKPDLAYRFFDHVRYVDGFMDGLDLCDVTLVLHDWGGGLGLSWARRHPDRVRAVAVMEAVVKPVRWSDAGLVERALFGLMRTRRVGDLLNRRGTFFLSRLMPMMTERTLTPEERAAYAAPYPTPDSRTPIAQWPREIPFSGSPADVHREISANYDWFRRAAVPKLLLHAEPGMILPPSEVAAIAAQVDDLEVVSVGRGRHHLQEDTPDAIGDALATWLRRTVLVDA